MAKLDEWQYRSVVEVARSGICRGFYAEQMEEGLALRYHTPYGWSGTAFILEEATGKAEPDARDTVERAVLLHSALLATVRPSSF